MGVRSLPCIMMLAHAVHMTARQALMSAQALTLKCWKIPHPVSTVWSSPCSLLSLVYSVACLDCRGFQAANHPSSFSQSECYKQYFTWKAWRVAAMSGPQAKVWQQRERLEDCEQKLNKINNSACSLMRIETLAEFKWGRLQSFEFWNHPEDILDSTGQHTATWQSTQKLVRR